MLLEVIFGHYIVVRSSNLRAWMDIVHKVLDSVGLTEEVGSALLVIWDIDTNLFQQYLNIMQARMGGGFLLHNEEGHESMKSMRAEG